MDKGPNTTLDEGPLQRSRTRGSAESPGVKLDPLADMIVLQRSRTRGSAERCRHSRPHRPRLPASTEPHSWECGEVVEVERVLSAALIKASTEPHSWECGETSILQYNDSIDKRFNGAALVGVRRATTARHSFPTMHGASTEPHSWECGEPPSSSNCRDSPGRFNGAALVGVRRDVRVCDEDVPVDGASTEPHSWECGEIPAWARPAPCM